LSRILSLAVLTTTLYLESLAGQAIYPNLSRQVFAAESSFAASMAQRNLLAFATFISPEAVFFGDTVALRGKPAVIEAWRPFFEGPEAPFSWKPHLVEVLPSGTLALSSGPIHDPAGKLVGTFNSIWRREPGGKWRVVFDKGGPASSPRCKP
jgi:ketosteroid isomerase-like protein